MRILKWLALYALVYIVLFTIVMPSAYTLIPGWADNQVTRLFWEKFSFFTPAIKHYGEASLFGFLSVDSYNPYYWIMTLIPSFVIWILVYLIYNRKKPNA